MKCCGKTGGQAIEGRGPFIQTASGHKFWPLDPRPEDVRYLDIATALSNQCRYAGHVPHGHYSVAEHSVHVSVCVEEWGGSPMEQLWGLLHDAAEAYVVDVPKPIKHETGMAFYRGAERLVQRAICERFGLPIEEPELVKQADGAVLAAECRDLFTFKREWNPGGKPEHEWAGRVRAGFSPRWSREQFLARLDELVARVELGKLAR